MPVSMILQITLLYRVGLGCTWFPQNLQTTVVMAMATSKQIDHHRLLEPDKNNFFLAQTDSRFSRVSTTCLKPGFHMR